MCLCQSVLIGMLCCRPACNAMLGPPALAVAVPDLVSRAAKLGTLFFVCVHMRAEVLAPARKPTTLMLLQQSCLPLTKHTLNHAHTHAA